MNYSVVFEDEHIIAVNKFPNIDFHTSDEGFGLSRQLTEDIGQVFPVHRLDKVTSGLILFAKSKEVASEISTLFSSRNINKTYLAIATGRPKKKQGTVSGDMAKSRRGAYKLLRTNENPAITKFRTALIKDSLRLYILKPITGRTHQLRVMMKSIGVPIDGDSLYSSKIEDDRVYLHSFSISFQIFGKDYDLKCLPTHGKKYLDNLEFIKKELSS